MAILRELACIAISLYLIVLFARAILSWFPAEPGSFLERANAFLGRLTDPVLVPLRRIIPPAGMFDLSYLVLFIGLIILRGLICGAAL